MQIVGTIFIIGAYYYFYYLIVVADWGLVGLDVPDLLMGVVSRNLESC